MAVFAISPISQLNAYGVFNTNINKIPYFGDNGDPINTTIPTFISQPTFSIIPSFSSQPTSTLVPTFTSQPTRTPILTAIPTFTVNPTITAFPTFSFVPTPTITAFPTFTINPTNTVLPTFTILPTRTAVPTFTFYPTPTTIPTFTILPTRTPFPSLTVLPTFTFYPTPTRTPFPSLTSLPTFTFYPTPTRTPIPTFTILPTRTPIPTFTVLPTPTQTITPTPTQLPQQPTVDLKINGQDDIATITEGDFAHITWSSRNATQCIASGQWSGFRGTFGFENQNPRQGVYRYILTCYNSEFSTTDAVYLYVNPKQATPTPTPTQTSTQTPTPTATPTQTPVKNLFVTLQASPNSGTTPFSSVLTATVTGSATGAINYRLDCEGDGIFETTVNGTFANPYSYSCTYHQAGVYYPRVEVTRDGLSANAFTQINGNTNYPTPTYYPYPSYYPYPTYYPYPYPSYYPYPTYYYPYNQTSVDLKANGNDGTVYVNQGNSVILSWNSNNANYCIATGNWSGIRSTSGSEVVYPSYSSNYRLECIGNNSSSVDEVYVSTNNYPYYTYQPYPYNSFNVNLTAKNVSTNGVESDITYARVGETVEFIIRVNQNSNVSASNVIIQDILPSGFRYLNGSTTKDDRYFFNNADEITRNGISIGSLGANETSVITFRAIAENDASYNSGSNLVISSAIARSNSAGSNQDNTSIYITKTTNVSNNNGISIEKLGKNITQGQASPQSNINAKPGDTIEFYIRVRSLSSSRLENVVVRDIMPSGITYLAGTTSINNNLVNDGIINGGVSIGSLEPNAEVIIRFNARVNSKESFVRGATQLTNTVISSSNNSSSSSSNLSIRINNGNAVVNIIKKAGTISTGSNMTLLLSVLIALIVTSAYVLKSRPNRSIIREINFAR